MQTQDVGNSMKIEQGIRNNFDLPGFILEKIPIERRSASFPPTSASTVCRTVTPFRSLIGRRGGVSSGIASMEHRNRGHPIRQTQDSGQDQDRSRDTRPPTFPPRKATSEQSRTESQRRQRAQPKRAHQQRSRSGRSRRGGRDHETLQPTAGQEGRSQTQPESVTARPSKITRRPAQREPT